MDDELVAKRAAVLREVIWGPLCDLTDRVVMQRANAAYPKEVALLAAFEAEARRDERRKVLRILIRESCLGEHAAGTTCRLCLMLAEDAAGEEVTK